MMGRTAEALVMNEKARELDPLNIVTTVVTAWILRSDGEYDKTIEACRKALEIDSNFFITYIVLWSTFWKKNQLEEALGACKQFLMLRGYLKAVRAVEEKSTTGDYRSAMKCAAEALAAFRKSEYVSATDIAILYAHAEEVERSLDWLERALEDRDPKLHLIGIDPDWEILHREPRFKDILHRLRLPMVATR
jgi:tetratricopeptide (TPR) repeat protein